VLAHRRIGCASAPGASPGTGAGGVMAVKMHPVVAARIRELAKGQRFVKAGRSYRREVGHGGGLVLEWEEKPPWEGYRSSAWFVDVCPAPLAEVWGRIWPRHAVPFVKVDPHTVRAGYFSPLGRELYQENGLKRDLGYFEDDPADVEAFLAHLERWFVDLAVPQGLAWLDDPALILEAMKAPPFSLDKDMQIRPDPGSS
jgi:hypothetical protein